MIRHVITSLISNTIGLLVAGACVIGFNIDTTDLVAFAALVAVFTAITLIIRPIIKLVLSPVIILTLGLFNLVINAGLVHVIDIYSTHINISGLPALIYGTLIITIINVVIQFVFHRPTVH
jgi:putative membrane protein